MSDQHESATPSDDDSSQREQLGGSAGDVVLLCPGCLTESTTSADFCTHCGMPIGHISTIDPIKRIRAEGWLYRRALRARPRRIVLAGMWLIFAPLVLGMGLVLRDLPWRSQWGHRSGPLPLTVVGVLVCVLSTVLYGTILYRMTQHYLNWQPRHCPTCGEEIESNTGICPECGAAIEGLAPETG